MLIRCTKHVEIQGNDGSGLHYCFCSMEHLGVVMLSKSTLYICLFSHLLIATYDDASTKTFSRLQYGKKTTTDPIACPALNRNNAWYSIVAVPTPSVDTYIVKCMSACAIDVHAGAKENPKPLQQTDELFPRPLAKCGNISASD